MKTKISSFALTFLAVSAIFVSPLTVAKADEGQKTEIIFRGSEAKMSLNLFKFQLKNKLQDLNLNLKFIAVTKDVDFNRQGLKSSETRKRLNKEIEANNNCKVIKENEPNQINATLEYRNCIALAFSADTIVKLNSSRQFPLWTDRLDIQKKVSVLREEMSLEAVDLDSDTISILTSLAEDVQWEVNKMYPNASEVSVIPRFVVVTK